jgi:PAS domain S-box-containing protein
MKNDALLRRSQALLAKLFRSSPAAVALVRRPDGVVIDVNDAYERLFGWSREEAIGRSTAALRVWVDPEDRVRLQQQLAQRGRVTDFESKVRRKSGEIFDSLLSSEVIEEGGEHMVLVIVLDITERKRVEAALRQSEQRYRTLAATMVEGILILQDGRFTYANPGALDLIGYSFEEIQGREFAPFIHPEDRELVRERHRRRTAGEVLEPRYDIRILPRSGEARWVQIANEKVDWEGRPSVLTVISDITERKDAEQALRESEQRFRTLVELSSDWYWVTDAEHRFTFREGEILHRMGLAPEADYGKRRWEIPDFVNMSAADWATHRARLERREEFRDLLLGRRAPDGRVHWATISGRPLRDAAGNFIGYHGTGRDVTQQVSAEERLRRFNVELERTVSERTAELDAANRELEAFTYSVSHDLRAPLRAIDGFSRMLEERHAGALGEEARDYLQRVRAAARRMGQLIEDLIAFSRIGRAALHKRAVDLSALARAVAKELEAGAPQRRVEWRLADGLAAHADPGLARLVLENLLGNAWKYTGKTPHAVIEFSRTAGGEFMVRDNGAGFDPAHSDGLFQPFRRLHAQEEFEGTGIGLATVKRIVERHGGQVRGEGAVGAGAAFYFMLPGGEVPAAPRALQ